MIASLLLQAALVVIAQQEAPQDAHAEFTKRALVYKPAEAKGGTGVFDSEGKQLSVDDIVLRTQSEPLHDAVDTRTRISLGSLAILPLPICAFCLLVPVGTALGTLIGFALSYEALARVRTAEPLLQLLTVLFVSPQAVFMGGTGTCIGGCLATPTIPAALLTSFLIRRTGRRAVEKTIPDAVRAYNTRLAEDLKLDPAALDKAHFPSP